MKANYSPLTITTQAARALDAGHDHPDGVVMAPVSTTRALARRGYVDYTHGSPGLNVKFGTDIPSTITARGRSEVQRRRAAALATELGTPLPDNPAPSWDVFGPCRRLGCDAQPGQCCIDVRRGSRAAVGEAHPLKNPHRGRPQVGPRADSLAHRTGAAR